jgi:hypothetical protein
MEVTPTMPIREILESKGKARGSEQEEVQEKQEKSSRSRRRRRRKS